MTGPTMIQTQASTRTPFSGSSALRRAAACAALPPYAAGPEAMTGVLRSMQGFRVTSSTFMCIAGCCWSERGEVLTVYECSCMVAR